MLVIKRTLKYSIIIGLVILILTNVFNFGVSNILYKTTYNNIEMYKIDLQQYFINLEKARSTVSLDFTSILPTRVWNTDIINNLALIFDWLYMPINFILWIIRFIVYLIKNILALCAVDCESGLMIGFNWIMQNLMIPYL